MPESLKVPATPHGAWLWDFLDGIDGDNIGVFFGEPHPQHGGRYWWRRFVREEVSALQSALKDRDAEIERLKAVLLHAKSDMRGFIENSLCAADPDRPFSDVRHEVKQHPSLKAIDDVLTGVCNA